MLYSTKNQTIEDIEKPTMSYERGFSAQKVGPDPLPLQFDTNSMGEHEAVPEAEQEDVWQGEAQTPQETTEPSQGNDDGTHLEANNQQPRRSERGQIPSTRYPETEYILLSEDGEPESFHEAISHTDKEKWLQAMTEEMNSLQKNNTYEIVKLPQGKKVLKSK